MQIKRFEAKDMTTALRLIKDELGPEAVILSARNIKNANTILGLTRSVGVEVTAAIDAYHLPAALNSASAAGGWDGQRGHTSISSGKKRNFRWSVGNRMKTLTRPRQIRPGQNRARPQNGVHDPDVFQHLLSQEVDRDIANEIADALSGRYPDSAFDTISEIVSKISNVLRHKKSLAQAPLHVRTDSRVLAVIGPTGVGKTTTVAKLAARHAIALKEKVALISLDSQRIGAAEQLKIYAKAIAIPFQMAVSPSGFRAALNEFRKFDLILVDTPGFNPEKQAEINDLKRYLECGESIRIDLALSAGTKQSDLFNTLKRLNTIAVQNLIFTKLDESRTHGNLINLLIRQALPVSFLTKGREVTGSVENASVEAILAYIFSSFTEPAGFSNAEGSGLSCLAESARPQNGYLVANKNSDVFHHPDCKWAQKIKSENRIVFATAQAAQENQFMPCRDCQPLKGAESEAGSATGAKLRISNYL